MLKLDKWLDCEAHRAPRFSNLSFSVIAFATVTPSDDTSRNVSVRVIVPSHIHLPFVILGPPNACSMITLRPVSHVRKYEKVEKTKSYAPLGPSVTLTAFARMSTPARIDVRPSFENLISLWAPRARTSFAERAARRTAEDERLPTRCMVRQLSIAVRIR
jgi:hypothetical protein